MGMENVEEKSTLTTKSVQVEAAYTKTSRRPATNTNSQTTSPSQTNQSNNTQTTSQSSNGFTTSQITAAATTVKNYVEQNNSLPTDVTIGNQKVTMAQFLYLLTTSIQKVNSNNQTSTTLRTVNTPTSPSETVGTGSFTKSEYLDIALRVKTYIENNGRAPNYASSSLGNVRFESLVFMFSRVMSYYGTNNSLPSTASIKPWSSSSSNGGTSTSGTWSTAIDQILKEASKYPWSTAASTAEGLMKYGSGDCWAMSDYLYKKLTAAGVQARIVQYATAYASNHRSVQIKINGAWVDVPYREYGFDMLFNSLASKPGMFVVMGG